MAKIHRTEIQKKIEKSLKQFKITALLGPRQVGKTTLSKDLIKNSSFTEIHFFDLEDPTDFDLLENPKLSLESLQGLIVIDEIQRRPELFKYLRVKADSMPAKTRILILGSSSRELVEQASESLAGRINYIEITGFTLAESKNEKRLFFRGGFPLSYTPKTDEESLAWRRSYIQSYIERDLNSLGINLPSQSLRRFIEMVAGYHGQIFNSSEIGKSMGISHTSARKYIDILIATFLLRELKPWNESIIQRQVKQSKIYFRDVGLLQYFLGIRSESELSRFPRVGSLWEGFALEETIKKIQAEPEDLYFWAIHQGGELDLLWKNSNKKIGFEFKYSDSIKMTHSMTKAIELLNLDHLYVIYPGKKSSKLAEEVSLIPLLDDFKL